MLIIMLIINPLFIVYNKKNTYACVWWWRCAQLLYHMFFPSEAFGADLDAAFAETIPKRTRGRQRCPLEIGVFS